MKKYFPLVFVASMIAACSSNNDLVQGNQEVVERIPLSIGAMHYMDGPTVTTRSAMTALHKDTISKYVELGLFVLGDGQATVASPTKLDYEHFNIKANVSDNTTVAAQSDIVATNATTDKLIYPSLSTTDINLYAYAPYMSTYAGTDISSTKVDVAVLDDQTKDKNYILSDILWGCVGKTALGKAKDNVSYPTSFSGKPEASITGANYVAAKGGTSTDGYTTSGKVIIPMLHRASKIVVKLTTEGMDISKLEKAKVTVFTPSLSSSMLISTGVLDKVSTTASPVIPATEVTMTDMLAYKEDGVTILTASDADANGTKGLIVDGSSNPQYYVCAAVIMPQDLAAGDKLFKIQLRDVDSDNNGTPETLGSTYIYVQPNPLGSITAFESGKVYTYTIKVKASGLLVTSTVADWADGGTSPGEAELY